MKKKIMSPEALAALAAGKPLVAQAEPVVGADANVEAPVIPEASGEEAAGEGEQEVSGDAFSAEDKAAFEAQIDDLATELADLNAQLKEAKAAVASLEAAALSTDAKIQAAAEEVSEFKAIVIGQISVMRTALSLGAVDMNNWTAEAILREHASISEAFEKALPEGSVIPETQPAAPKKIVTTSHDAAAYAALDF